MQIYVITPNQSKAARALLNWSQKDLSKLCGISMSRIADFERGVSTPRLETMGAISNIFIEHGIEFIRETGVNLIITNSDS